MSKENRSIIIMEMLRKNGGVQSKELCKLFNVTDMTIRRDLEFLASQKLIIRTHG